MRFGLGVLGGRTRAPADPPFYVGGDPPPHPTPPKKQSAFKTGDSALGVGGGGSAPTPPNCRPKGLRNVGLWASPGMRLRIAVGKC